MILTEQQFHDIPAGNIFVIGEVENSPLGIYMTDSNKGKMMKWLAKKGCANDWCIYIHWSESGFDFVESNGDKVTSEDNIKKLVPCTDEVFKQYRH